jgi:uncharacterized membrane-anchored protein YitT (DUF2179 family)
MPNATAMSLLPDPATAARHTVLDDAQGLVFGTSMCAFALVLLQHLGLVTGQTAGLALILSYWSGWSFGLVFSIVNLPFYWLAFRRMGLRFTLKTFLAVGLLSLFTTFLPRWIDYGTVNPAVGAIFFGFICGAGLLALFRHGASLGGVGILALYLQDKTGFRAGWTQLIFDACVFALALVVIEPGAVMYSLLGAVVVNLVIAINHRKDRYIGF